MGKRFHPLPQRASKPHPLSSNSPPLPFLAILRGLPGGSAQAYTDPHLRHAHPDAYFHESSNNSHTHTHHPTDEHATGRLLTPRPSLCRSPSLCRPYEIIQARLRLRLGLAAGTGWLLGAWSLLFSPWFSASFPDLTLLVALRALECGSNGSGGTAGGGFR